MGRMGKMGRELKSKIQNLKSKIPGRGEDGVMGRMGRMVDAI